MSQCKNDACSSVQRAQPNVKHDRPFESKTSLESSENIVSFPPKNPLNTLSLDVEHDDNDEDSEHANFACVCEIEKGSSDSSSDANDSTDEELQIQQQQQQIQRQQQQIQQQQQRKGESSSLPSRPIVEWVYPEEDDVDDDCRSMNEEEVDVGSVITDIPILLSDHLEDQNPRTVRVEDVVVVTDDGVEERATQRRSSRFEEEDVTSIYEGTIVTRNKPQCPTKLIICIAVVVVIVVMSLLAMLAFSKMLTTNNSLSRSGGPLVPTSVASSTSPSPVRKGSVAPSSSVNVVEIPAKRIDGSVLEGENTTMISIAFADDGNLLFVGSMGVLEIYDLSSRGNDERYYQARSGPLRTDLPMLVHSSRDGSWIVVVEIRPFVFSGYVTVLHNDRIIEGELRDDNGDGWKPIGRILEGNDPNDGFGFSVSITNDGQFLVVGAMNSDLVVWYGMQNGDWIALREFKGPKDTGFGTNVIIAADRPSMLLVTAPGGKEKALNPGFFFAYDLLTGNVQQINGAKNEYGLGMALASSANCDRIVLSVALVMDRHVEGIKVYQREPADENSLYVQIGNTYSSSPLWERITTTMSADGRRVVVGAAYVTTDYTSGMFVFSVRENGLRLIGSHTYEVKNSKLFQTREIVLSDDGSRVALVVNLEAFKGTSVRAYEL